MARIRLLSLGLLTLVMAVTATACQGYAEPVAEEPRVLRLMVFPTPDGGLDPSSEAGLDRLSTVAGVPLNHLGRMGGGHVVVTQAAVDAHQVRAILRRMLDHPAIAHVEEDRRVTIQSGPGETR